MAPHSGVTGTPSPQTPARTDGFLKNRFSTISSCTISTYTIVGHRLPPDFQYLHRVAASRRGSMNCLRMPGEVWCGGGAPLNHPGATPVHLHRVSRSRHRVSSNGFGIPVTSWSPCTGRASKEHAFTSGVLAGGMSCGRCVRSPTDSLDQRALVVPDGGGQRLDGKYWRMANNSTEPNRN